jgi:hypothetical protein
MSDNRYSVRYIEIASKAHLCSAAITLAAKPRKRKKIAAPEISPEAAPFKESGSQPEPRTQRHPLQLVRLHFPYPIVGLGTSAFHKINGKQRLPQTHRYEL